jgi:hypothetical protein
MPTYRVHDYAGDDLGLVEHPAPNVESGDVVVLADGRQALVTVPSRPSRDRSRRARACGLARRRLTPSTSAHRLPLTSSHEPSVTLERSASEPAELSAAESPEEHFGSDAGPLRLRD